MQRASLKSLAVKAMGVALLSATSAVALTPVTLKVPAVIEPCAPATILWNASAGLAPWTITVAPVNSTPSSVTIPADYMTSTMWGWDWHVPDFANATQQVIVAISDSTGQVGAASSLITLSPSTAATKPATCKAPKLDMDFTWNAPATPPQECNNFEISWKNVSDASPVVAPVRFAVIPENGIPMSYYAPADTTSWPMIVNIPATTNFVIAAFDGGATTTGEVSAVYTVAAAADKSTCAKLGVAPSPGLVSATATKVASAPEAAESKAAAAATKAVKHKKTPVVAIVAATMAAAIIVALMFAFLRRRRQTNAVKSSGGEDGNTEKWADPSNKWSGQPLGKFGSWNPRGQDAAPATPQSMFQLCEAQRLQQESKGTMTPTSVAQQPWTVKSTVPNNALCPPIQPVDPVHAIGPVPSAPQGIYRTRSNSAARPAAQPEVVPDARLFPPPQSHSAPGSSIHGSNPRAGQSGYAHSYDVGDAGQRTPSEWSQPSRAPSGLTTDQSPPSHLAYLSPQPAAASTARSVPSTPRPQIRPPGTNPNSRFDPYAQPMPVYNPRMI